MSDRPQTVSFYRKRLPHWEVADGRYFVTIRLAGSLPKEAEAQIRTLSDQLKSQKDRDRQRLHRHVFRLMERWLDRSVGVRHLQVPDVAHMVMDAIKHYETTSVWRMHEYVVMPNHLHLFFSLGEKNLTRAMEDFKRWTTRRAKQILKLTEQSFWQREWFDHWSRSAAEDEKICCYIRDNPVKAGLVERFEDWPYGSWHQ